MNRPGADGKEPRKLVFKCTFNKKLAEHPVKVAWIAQDTKGVAPENYGKLGVSAVSIGICQHAVRLCSTHCQASTTTRLNLFAEVVAVRFWLLNCD